MNFNKDERVDIPQLKFPEPKKSYKNSFNDLFIPKQPRISPGVKKSQSPKWIRKPNTSRHETETQDRRKRRSSISGGDFFYSPNLRPLRKSLRKKIEPCEISELLDKPESSEAPNEWEGSRLRNLCGRDSKRSTVGYTQTRAKLIMGLANSQLEQTTFLSNDGKKCSTLSYKVPDKRSSIDFIKDENAKRQRSTMSTLNGNPRSSSNINSKSKDIFYKDCYGFDSYKAVSSFNFLINSFINITKKKK